MYSALPSLGLKLFYCWFRPVRSYPFGKKVQNLSYWHFCHSFFPRPTSPERHFFFRLSSIKKVDPRDISWSAVCFAIDFIFPKPFRSWKNISTSLAPFSRLDLSPPQPLSNSFNLADFFFFFSSSFQYPWLTHPLTSRAFSGSLDVMAYASFPFHFLLFDISNPHYSIFSLIKIW